MYDGSENMDKKAMKYIGIGVILLLIASVSMSLIGTTILNGICLILGILEAGYGIYLANR